MWLHRMAVAVVVISNVRVEKVAHPLLLPPWDGVHDGCHGVVDDLLGGFGLRTAALTDGVRT